MTELRFSANNIAECVLLDQERAWVLWVTVKCWLRLIENDDQKDANILVYFFIPNQL